MPHYTLLAVALIGCSTSVDLDTADAELPLDREADPDDDGLTTGEELDGYEILVDQTGVWDRVNGRIDDPRTVMWVTSNPLAADTDGDGLTDLEERAWAIDPTRADTDGDGLSDFDELNRWDTSPASVDTDGDATGGRTGTASPLPDLFDGAELHLEWVDGLWQAGLDATSPLLVDTDGDGASDYYEWLSPTRDGAVPERPTFEMRVTPSTQVALDLNVVWGVDSEHSDSYSISSDRTSTSTWAKDFDGSAGLHGSFDLWVGVKVGAEASVNLTSFPVGAEASAEVYGGTNLTVGGQSALTYGSSEGWRRSSRQTQEQMTRDERTTNQTISGGRIAVTFDVVNTGTMAFTLTDLSLGVGRHDYYSGEARPVTTMHAATPTMTLGSGERTTVFFEDDDMPADRAMEILENPSSLVFAPVSYGIERSDGIDLDYADEDIELRTARVTVQHADGTERTFSRASDLRRDADGNALGFTVRELLADVGVQAESRETVSGAIVYDIDGVPSEQYTEDPPDLPYAAEGRWLKSGWFVYLTRDTRNGPRPDDLLDTPLFAGDRASIIQVTDLDRDGLTSWTEAQLGTSDERLDSDGDGLTDVYELHVEHLIGEHQGELFYGHSDPGAVDSDGDGLSDAVELAACLDARWFWPGLCLNPLSADTDNDGIPDDVERSDPDASYTDPWYYNYQSNPVGECVTVTRTFQTSQGPRHCRSLDIVFRDPDARMTLAEVSGGATPINDLGGDIPSFDWASIETSVGLSGTVTLRDVLAPEYTASLDSPHICDQAGSLALRVWSYTGLEEANVRGRSIGISCDFGGEL